jgi:hypothetical protein
MKKMRFTERPRDDAGGHDPNALRLAEAFRHRHT